MCSAEGCPMLWSVSALKHFTEGDCSSNLVNFIAANPKWARCKIKRITFTHLSQVVQVGLVPDQIGRGRVLQLAQLGQWPLGVLVARPVRDAVYDEARVRPLDLLHGEIITILRRDVHNLYVQHAAVQCDCLLVQQVRVGPVLADEPPRQVSHCEGCWRRREREGEIGINFSGNWEGWRVKRVGSSWKQYPCQCHEPTSCPSDVAVPPV